jgi:hypothetical protein
MVLSIFVTAWLWPRTDTRRRAGPADLGAAVKRVIRLLLKHSGDGLTDDVALVLASSRDNVT